MIYSMWRALAANVHAQLPSVEENPGLLRRIIMSTHVNLFELEAAGMKLLKISRGQLFAYMSVDYYAGCGHGAG